MLAAAVLGLALRPAAARAEKKKVLGLFDFQKWNTPLGHQRETSSGSRRFAST